MLKKEIFFNYSVYLIEWIGKENIAIFEPNNPIYCLVNLSLVGGHKGPFIDVKFSPFHSHLIVTATNNYSVKLWEIV